MPGWLWAVIAVVLGVLIYLSLRRRGGGGRRRGDPAIEYFPDEHRSRDELVDREGHVELEGHVDREGHVELEGHVERESLGGDVHEEPPAEEPPAEEPRAEVQRAERAAAEEVRAEPASPSRSARTNADPNAPAAPDRRASEYGPGSAVPDPTGIGPQGWTVKGNADSMLFYTAEAPSYLRLSADVWFESEEAAITAGFTRWNAHHR